MFGNLPGIDGSKAGQLQEIASAMQSIDGMANLLTKGNPSLAGLIADFVNHSRMDTKVLAEHSGAKVSTSLMTEERAAELIAEAVVNGNKQPLLETFNNLQKRRNKILREVAPADEIEALENKKKEVSNAPLSDGGSDGT